MKISESAVNAVAIEAGRWVSVAHAFPGVKFKVRGIGNSDYRLLYDKLIAEFPRADRIKGLNPAVLDKIKSACLVETVLMDWSGWENDDGKPLNWSKAVAAKYLTDPNYVLLCSAVEWAATVVGEDDLAEAEDAAKN